MNWPKYSLFGRNEGNKAHSNHDSGLFIDDGLIDDMGNTIATTFQPRDVNFLLNYYLGSSASQTPLGDVERLIRSGQPVTAIVKDFVGYKVFFFNRLFDFSFIFVKQNHQCFFTYLLTYSLTNFNSLILSLSPWF
jgi:hypothetical protein